MKLAQSVSLSGVHRTSATNLRRADSLSPMQIGLHRDWEKWGLPIEEVAIRRTVMWEVRAHVSVARRRDALLSDERTLLSQCITFDSWSAHGFGRPPSQAVRFDVYHPDTVLHGIGSNGRGVCR